jgi:predicted GNAT family acetyltransferase
MEMSVIRVLKPGDEAALEAFLLPQVESSMFLIGNMRAAGLTDHGQTYQGTYAAKLEGGKIVGVVAHYWNQNLVFQAPVDLVALCAEAVKGSGHPIQGLIGPSDQVGMAKEMLDMDRSNVQMDETEKLYSLELEDLVVPGSLASGKVKGRRIESGDVDLLTKWRVAYAVEALGEEDSPQVRQQCREVTERSVREKRTWVLEACPERSRRNEGRPVACSSFNTAIEEAVQVGGVWTPPELRRRGYGRAVVAASLLDARTEGVKKGILFTGEDNIAAQRAYEALGFRCIGNYSIVLLRSPLKNSLQKLVPNVHEGMAETDAGEM